MTRLECISLHQKLIIDDYTATGDGGEGSKRMKSSRIALEVAARAFPERPLRQKPLVPSAAARPIVLPQVSSAAPGRGGPPCFGSIHVTLQQRTDP